MLKGLARVALLAMAVAGVANAQAPQQRDPLNGLFGAIEVAMSPAEAAADAMRIGDALAKLPAQRPGVVDTYILTASLWDEPVFENEAREAASILARRYDAAERTITLSAGRGPGAARTYPSATPNNFNAALGRIGKLADPNEDLVVVFFTSHGGPDGAVAMQEKGRLGGAIRALHLRTSLQQANIKSKLVIVSACYSGYFILPFSNDDTVVLTAAAADDPVSVWRAVDADRRQFDAGKSAEEVMRLPIWHGQTPDWAREAWREMAESQELLDAGFAPWLRWYEAAAAFDGLTRSERDRELVQQGPGLGGLALGC